MSTFTRLTATTLFVPAAIIAFAGPAAAHTDLPDPHRITRAASTDQIVRILHEQGFRHPAANRFAREIC
jgi:hypothetical protein